jgi:hypothetical protein
MDELWIHRDTLYEAISHIEEKRHIPMPENNPNNALQELLI